MGVATEVHKEVEGMWGRQAVGAQWMRGQRRMTVSQPWTTATTIAQGNNAMNAEDMRFAAMVNGTRAVGCATGCQQKVAQTADDSLQVCC